MGSDRDRHELRPGRHPGAARPLLTESRCILDYIERHLPGYQLYPSDGFRAAKLLERTQIVDLYRELPARRLLRNFFGRTKPPASVADEVSSVVTGGANKHLQSLLCGCCGRRLRSESSELGAAV